MTKHLRGFLLLFLTLLANCLTWAQPVSYNFGLEDIDQSVYPKDWYLSPANKGYLTGLDSMEKQEGRYALSITAVSKSGSGGFGVCSYAIPATFEGKKIELKGYLKAENIANGYAGLWMRIDGEHQKVLEFDNMSAKPLKGTSDWKQYSIELPYDSKGAKKIAVGALLTGQGKVWMDHLEIFIDGKPLSDINSKAYNLGLEYTHKPVSPLDWNFITQNNVYVTGLDTVEKQEGKYAMSIVSVAKPDVNDYGVCSYTIPATFEGKKIQLKGYLKAENISNGYAGLWMRIDDENQRPLEFDNMAGNPLKGTAAWKQYSIELPYNSRDAKSIIVGALLTGEGKVWMDHLEVFIDGMPLKDVSPKIVVMANADKDSLLNEKSNIVTLDLSEGRLQRLVNLGQVWGFMKYYHPAVAAGNYNMDAELFRLLPDFNAAVSDAAAYALLEKWVDHLDKPEKCDKCNDLDLQRNKLNPDYGDLFTKGNLPETLREKLEWIRQNRPLLKEHYYIAMERNVGNPSFKNENPFLSTTYPDAGVRLLALYRYWSMILYFFPDRHLITGGWNGDVLKRFIPQFVQAANAEEYYLACLKLIACIGDTHANLYSRNGVLDGVKGNYISPFKAAFIEGHLVVTQHYVSDDIVKNNFAIGDIIEKIDGRDVDSLMKYYLPLTPASNYETQLRDMPSLNGFLLRSNEENASFTVRNAAGISRTISTKRIGLASVGSLGWGDGREHTAYEMLPGNIGYIYPAKLTDGDLSRIRDTFENTKGLVIDLRCYPTSFMPFSYGSWLKDDSSGFVRFTGGNLSTPGTFVLSEDALANGTANNKNAYKGKLVLIVNSSTQSQAEYTVMALGTVKGAVVLGSTTAGADGNVSSIELPGGVITMISGIGILYPDGTESQRVGVKIDQKMKVTIAGIREGKDELLERALSIIHGSQDKPAAQD